MSRYTINAREITKEMSFGILSSALQHIFVTRDLRVGVLVTKTGIGKGRLAAYRDGTQAPQLYALLSLIKELGPDFLNRMMAPLGIGGAHWLDREDTCVLKINGALSRLAERIGAALEDGVICHREIAELVPVARRLHSALGAFLLKYDNGNPATPERVRGRHNPKQPCWLDGRKVGTAEVIQAAHERLDQLWDRGPWEPR